MWTSVFFITDVHDEGDTTPEYQPPEIPDMDIKPMMKGKEDFRSVISSDFFGYGSGSGLNTDST